MQWILRTKTVITRKPHRCFGCGRVFLQGTEMLYQTVKDDEIYSDYFCETCQKIMSKMKSGEEVWPGSLYDEAIEMEAENGKAD